ncbi:hypothetical protein NUSPORA_00552 [Nucleospora cyclopteri]
MSVKLIFMKIALTTNITLNTDFFVKDSQENSQNNFLYNKISKKFQYNKHPNKMSNLNKCICNVDLSNTFLHETKKNQLFSTFSRNFLLEKQNPNKVISKYNKDHKCSFFEINPPLNTKKKIKEKIYQDNNKILRENIESIAIIMNKYKNKYKPKIKGLNLKNNIKNQNIVKINNKNIPQHLFKHDIQSIELNDPIKNTSYLNFNNSNCQIISKIFQKCFDLSAKQINILIKPKIDLEKIKKISLKLHTLFNLCLILEKNNNNHTKTTLNHYELYFKHLPKKQTSFHSITNKKNQILIIAPNRSIFDSISSCKHFLKYKNKKLDSVQSDYQKNSTKNINYYASQIENYKDEYIFHQRDDNFKPSYVSLSNAENSNKDIYSSESEEEIETDFTPKSSDFFEQRLFADTKYIKLHKNANLVEMYNIDFDFSTENIFKKADSDYNRAKLPNGFSFSPGWHNFCLSENKVLKTKNKNSELLNICKEYKLENFFSLIFNIIRINTFRKKIPFLSFELCLHIVCYHLCTQWELGKGKNVEIDKKYKHHRLINNNNFHKLFKSKQYWYNKAFKIYEIAKSRAARELGITISSFKPEHLYNVLLLLPLKNSKTVAFVFYVYYASISEELDINLKYISMDKVEHVIERRKKLHIINNEYAKYKNNAIQILNYKFKISKSLD